MEIKHMTLLAWAYYAFKIAYYAFKQCSKNLLIMLQLWSELSHYTLNMQAQFYSWMLAQSEYFIFT